MINSKNELKRKLQENKNNINFRTIENHCAEGFQVGIIRKVGTKLQTNAFTIETFSDEKWHDSWVYYEDIEIKNNIITYKKAPIKIEIIELSN